MPDQPSDPSRPARRDLLLGLGAATALAAAPRALAAPAASWPLWQVERNGGIVHLTGETPPRATDWHDAWIERVLRGAGVLWTETNRVQRGDVQALVARYGMAADKPLDAWLTPEDRARVAKAAAICRVPPDSIAPLRPWLAGASLQQSYYAAAGQSGKSGDAVLAEQAKAAGIAVSSEFAAQDDVFAWFGAMSPAQDVQFLRYALDEILAGPATGRIYDDWAAGRFERAAAVMERMSRTSPDLFARIAIERNRGWLPRFAAMCGEGKKGLVVTGLYHLVGPSNLIAQLRSGGFGVRRV
jgi:uncharacterized protein YbaP (TraB family)